MRQDRARNRYEGVRTRALLMNSPLCFSVAVLLRCTTRPVVEVLFFSSVGPEAHFSRNISSFRSSMRHTREHSVLLCRRTPLLSYRLKAPMTADFFDRTKTSKWCASRTRIASTMRPEDRDGIHV